MVFGQLMDIGSQQRLGRGALFMGRFTNVVRDDSPARVASSGMVCVLLPGRPWSRRSRVHSCTKAIDRCMNAPYGFSPSRKSRPLKGKENCLLGHPQNMAE